jgi:hypothetical protein
VQSQTTSWLRTWTISKRTDRFVDAERARAVAELERREVFARDGHLSLASWMVARHGVAPSTAAGHVRMARALEQMPVAADALWLR